MAKKKKIGSDEMEEVMGEISELFDGEVRVTCASDSEIAQYARYVDIVLEALDHSDAWVSDESTIGDFTCSNSDKLNQLVSILGVGPISESDRIVDVAERLSMYAYVD